LNPLARGFRLGGSNLPAVMQLSVAEAQEFFERLELHGEAADVAREVLSEIRNRIRVMSEIGLDYLQLGRGAGTLSGGESQRLRLATQLGNRLVGVLYVLDEPTIGLHSRDTERLLKTLRELRDLGNTLLLVEHDTDVILAADHIIEIGPGAGHHGGRVVAMGSPDAITRDPASLTGAFLRGERNIVRATRPTAKQATLVISGARRNNLRGVSAEIPTRSLVCVTGVSGSGKSTFVLDVLEPALREWFDNDGELDAATLEFVDSLAVPPTIRAVERVDQSPLAVTPGANAATYTGVFDVVRHQFASTPESRARGYSAARFSTNVRGGRCEACEGRGEVQIEMHFLSDVYVVCEACGGKRFDKATLEIRWNGLSIAEVLALEIGVARTHFAGIPGIDSVLAILEGVGLGYLKLGQPLHTLSGGEAQRVKLAAVLGQRHRAPTLFLLDEPTTGLHLADVAKLLEVFEKLLGLGHSLLVIEHHLELIRAADYVIDLGPGGGPAGGLVVAAGPPDAVARVANSATGQRLASATRSEPVRARRREEIA
jgi:excinuclease ABC subunit A